MELVHNVGGGRRRLGRVMVDASAMLSGIRGGGIYYYLLKLLPRLSVIAKEHGGELSLLNLYFRGSAGVLPPELAGLRVHHLRFPVRLLNHLWLRCGLPDLSWLYGGVDVFHSPHFSLPVMSGARKILTVHDIAYLIHPEYYEASEVKLNDYGYKTLLGANVLRADRIIAISQHTKSDLMRRFDLPESKIAVVYFGCDHPPRIESGALERMLGKYGLNGRRYVYFPAGTIHPRKNIQRVVRAFCRTVGSGGRCKLVISGVGGKGQPALDSNGAVEIVRWDTELERDALYQGSEFVVYPSLYEGFGMPAVEAMGNGKALLTSSSSSLKEIAEGYAHMVNPEEEDSIADGMRRMGEDSDYRHGLEKKAIFRAGCFSWDKMAEQAYKVYEDALK